MKRFLSTTVCIFSSISFKLLQQLHLTETEYKLQMELKSFNTYIFKMYKDAKGKKKKANIKFTNISKILQLPYVINVLKSFKEISYIPVLSLLNPVYILYLQNFSIWTSCFFNAP